MDELNELPEPMMAAGVYEFESHDAGSCELCPGCADRLYRIEAMLDRLRPLVEVLEGFAPILAASSPDANGKRPNALKMAMAASKLAKG